MVRLAKGLVALAILWSLWWGGWTVFTRMQVAGWFADRAAAGWQAEYASASSAGFPLMHATTLEQPALADPATGVAWRADWLRLESPAYRPGQQTLRFPDSVQLVSYLDQTHAVQAADLTAALIVDPLNRLELSEGHVRSGRWHSGQSGLPGLSGAGFDLTILQEEAPDTYRVTAGATELRLTFPADAQDQAAMPVFDIGGSLRLDAVIGFSRPWDITAISDGRPQPTRIRLRLAQAEWAGLQIHAAGKLEVDENGLPTGKMTLKAENWQEVLDAVTEAGALPGSVAGTLRGTLDLLARFAGTTNSLDVTITFGDGKMSAGLIPLGPAPRILLH